MSPLTSNLAEFVMKPTIVIIVLLAVHFALQRASAATRHLTLTLGLVSLLVLPFLTLSLPAWDLEVLPASAGPVAVGPPGMDQRRVGEQELFRVPPGREVHQGKRQLIDGSPTREGYLTLRLAVRVEDANPREGVDQLVDVQPITDRGHGADGAPRLGDDLDPRCGVVWVLGVERDGHDPASRRTDAGDREVAVPDHVSDQRAPDLGDEGLPVGLRIREIQQCDGVGLHQGVVRHSPPPLL